MTGLRFDDKYHEYRYDDVPVPSVTQILGDFEDVSCGIYRYKRDVLTGRLIPAETMRIAAKFGTYVHKACALLLRNNLRWGSVPPEYAPILLSFEEWLDENPKVRERLIFVEEPMYSEKYQYAGTPDFGYKDGRGHVIVDIKTGPQRKTHGAQLAAYEELYRENNKPKATIERYCLYLSRDGKPATLKRYDSPDDWQYFLSMLNIRNYRGTE